MGASTRLGTETAGNSFCNAQKERSRSHARLLTGWRVRRMCNKSAYTEHKQIQRIYLVALTRRIQVHHTNKVRSSSEYEWNGEAVTAHRHVITPIYLFGWSSTAWTVFPAIRVHDMRKLVRAITAVFWTIFRGNCTSFYQYIERKCQMY